MSSGEVKVKDTGGNMGHMISANNCVNTGGFKTHVVGRGRTTQFYRWSPLLNLQYSRETDGGRKGWCNFNR